jgi:hypothetical protein
VVQTVHVEDGIRSPLELLPILPAARMADLLASELEKLGFVRDGDVARRAGADGIEVIVDLVASTVTVKISADKELTASATATAIVDEDLAVRPTEALRKKAIAEATHDVAAQKATLQREVTARLEGKLADLRAELDGAIGRATIGALTERASQLGTIEELVTDEAGNITIKVKV